MTNPTQGWPEDNQPAYFGDLVDPILKAIKFCYRLQRKNRTKDVPWSGPGLGGLHVAFDAKETLSADQLAFSMEDQGRSAIEEIVGVALRLGIEQGRRIEVSDTKGSIIQLIAKSVLMLDEDTGAQAKMGKELAKLLTRD